MALNKDTRMTLWWLLFIAIAAVMTALFLYPRYQLLRENQQKLKYQNEQLAEKKTEREKLRSEVDALQNSPAAVEKVAREEYNMAKPGETVMLYPEKDPAKEK